MANEEIQHTTVYEFRPLSEGDYLRYAGGSWVKDDGQWDLAFVLNKPTFIYIDIAYYEHLLWSWVKNGDWGAIDSSHPSGNAWHYMSSNGKDWGPIITDRYQHPNVIASRSAGDKCCSLYSGGSGGGAEFTINDPYISAGLLRRRDTKEIVKFPDIFECIHCGSHDWRAEENLSKVAT